MSETLDAAMKGGSDVGGRHLHQIKSIIDEEKGAECGFITIFSWSWRVRHPNYGVLTLDRHDTVVSICGPLRLSKLGRK